ncbi:MAG: NAD-binding protein [Elusimicrobiota bacterium]
MNIFRDIPKRILVAFILMVIVFFVGTFGYMVIEHWKFLDSLFMTVITLATVGYGETNPLTTQGRIFTIFLILTGIGILTYVFTTGMSFLIEGELTGLMRRRKMEKAIKALKNHYIICVDSETGEYAIEEFVKTKQDVVVITNNKHIAEKLNESILLIYGNPEEDRTLQTAGIENAAGLVSILQEDKDNLFVVLSAKGFNPNLKIVTQAKERESVAKLQKAGADEVISTNLIGGMRIASAALRPTVVSFLDRMLYQTVDNEPLRIEEETISDKSPLTGKALSDCNINEKVGLIVIAIRESKTEKFIYNPKQNYKLNSGDTLIVIGTPTQVKQLHSLIEVGV